MSTYTAAWGGEIEAWATALRAAGRSEETIRLRTHHVGRLGRWAGDRGPWALTLDDLLAWTGGQRWQPDTRRSVRASLRGFYRWAHLTGRVEADPAVGLPTIPPTPPAATPAPPHAVGQALAEADERVHLMIRLAHEVGLRRGEVARIHVGRDLTRDLLGWTLRVHGKGGRVRDVPLPDDLAAALAARGPGWAFPGDDDGHLSPDWVGKLVGRLLPGGVTMHDLRHLCATELHDDTHDLRAVQRLLGHASVATTERYVRVRDETVRTMVTNRARRWAA